MKSPEACNPLQSGSDSVLGWFTANYIKLNISKTKLISFSRKTGILISDYKFFQSSITRTGSILWEYL
jgi:hypothetical protein